jgi:hypothetical protein
MDALRNTPYAVVSSTERKQMQMFERKFFGRSVLFYLDPKALAVALASVCPHRFAALHLGKVVHEVSAVEVGRALDRLIEKDRVGSDARRRSVSTMGSTV